MDPALPSWPVLQLLINGKFVDAKSGKTFENLDPRTGEILRQRRGALLQA